MKSKLAVLSMFAALTALGDSKIYHEPLPKESIKEKNDRIKRKMPEIYKSQGLTEFFYGENSLWALNQKSADRKARKLKWI